MLDKVETHSVTIDTYQIGDFVNHAADFRTGYIVSLKQFSSETLIRNQVMGYIQVFEGEAAHGMTERQLSLISGVMLNATHAASDIPWIPMSKPFTTSNDWWIGFDKDSSSRLNGSYHESVKSDMLKVIREVAEWLH